MKKRIKIDDVWFIEESAVEQDAEQDFDITYSLEASSGIFDCVTLAKEGHKDNNFEPCENECFITAYIDGRDKKGQSWDNPAFLRRVRGGIYEYDIERELTALELKELRNLLVAVTEKGWL